MCVLCIKIDLSNQLSRVYTTGEDTSRDFRDYFQSKLVRKWEILYNINNYRTMADDITYNYSKSLEAYVETY